MKLRNKKTGEVKEVIVGGYPVSGKTEMWECSEIDFNEESGYKCLGIYNSLTELNEEWEDYTENEYYYAITSIKADDGITKMKNKHNDMTAFDKSIGNYFETKEEAEKAVEKLKAWQRLKDKGFEIESWTTNIGDNYYKTGQIVLNLNNVINRDWDEYDQISEIKKDLDICFEGEE